MTRRVYVRSQAEREKEPCSWWGCALRRMTFSILPRASPLPCPVARRARPALWTALGSVPAGDDALSPASLAATDFRARPFLLAVACRRPFIPTWGGGTSPCLLVSCPPIHVELHGDVGQRWFSTPRHWWCRTLMDLEDATGGPRCPERRRYTDETSRHSFTDCPGGLTWVGCHR
jgi:hypothetical protein